jgi:hypothetical protein
MECFVVEGGRAGRSEAEEKRDTVAAAAAAAHALLSPQQFLKKSAATAPPPSLQQNQQQKTNIRCSITDDNSLLLHEEHHHSVGEELSSCMAQEGGGGACSHLFLAVSEVKHVVTDVRSGMEQLVIAFFLSCASIPVSKSVKNLVEFSLFTLSLDLIFFFLRSPFLPSWHTFQCLLLLRSPYRIISLALMPQGRPVKGRASSKPQPVVKASHEAGR